MTERHIRSSLLDNAKRLLPLRPLPLDAKIAMILLTHAYTVRRPTFRALAVAIPNRRLALATIWRLIARGSLRVDLSLPTTLESELRHE